MPKFIALLSAENEKPKSMTRKQQLDYVRKYQAEIIAKMTPEEIIVAKAKAGKV